MYIYVFVPSVLGPNLQLTTQELISPNSFYETLNKGKTVPLNIQTFFFLLWQTIWVNFNESVRKYTARLTLACTFPENECIN